MRVDSENTNQANYEDELCFITQLITALEYVIDQIDEHPVRYPAFMADILCLTKGRLCKMSNGNQVFVNGLEQQIDELYLTLERLGLEVDYEGGGEDEEVQA